MSTFAATGAAVADLERAAAFYVEVFGLRKLRTYDLDHMDEQLLGTGKPGEPALVLMQYKGRDTPPHDTEATKFVFYVRDAAATAAAVVANRGRITRPPAEFGGALVAFAVDPDGYLLELVQVSSVPQ